MTTTFDDEIGAKSTFGSGLAVRRDSSGQWIEGEVGTPNGFVRVYHQWSDERPYARFDFIWRGRMHIRTINGKRYTKVGLARMASRFAKEVAAR